MVILVQRSSISMLISADRGPPGPPAISVCECQKLLAGPLLSHQGQQSNQSQCYQYYQLATPKWNIYYNLLKSFTKNVSKVNYGLSLPPDTCRGGSSIVEKQPTWLHHGKLLSSGNGFIGQNKGILCCYIVMDKFEGELGLPRKLSIIIPDIGGY